MNKPDVCLISCCKTKLKHPARAIDLYTSDLFIKSRKFATQYGLPIYILSAKHHLVHADTLLVPYELTLNKMSTNEREEWYKYVAIQITKELVDKNLLVLAGDNYLGFSDRISNKIINPLNKLPIGKRLQWLKTHTK
ncbi:hypothetical protein PCC6912_39940 [Chlorogloeopsis fritschii PCC 6912]|uniref:DUF6884 domain-containing protein n=1 Tax=Chlorogloeopsis fritschii PCC 6912 TaxID=211165 RepID=A0A3S0XT47_CHLFR|nr:DUF6884 domain-containing protein [Chlorogloeopsis fritschii]RUR77035.1 hypothetical protein PCC6912_39940 [Chlorogloeopsis fritschii PCC 6912]